MTTEDTTVRDNSATLPPGKREFRHFYERQTDGTQKPVTFRFIKWGHGFSAYEYEGRTYQPHLIAAMVRAGILRPCSGPEARIYRLYSRAA